MTLNILIWMLKSSITLSIVKILTVITLTLLTSLTFSKDIFVFDPIITVIDFIILNLCLDYQAQGQGELGGVHFEYTENNFNRVLNIGFSFILALGILEKGTFLATLLNYILYNR